MRRLRGSCVSLVHEYTVCASVLIFFVNDDGFGDEESDLDLLREDGDHWFLVALPGPMFHL